MRVIIFFTIFFIVSLNVYSQTDWKWISPDPPNKMVYSSTVAENKAYFWCEHNAVIKLDMETEKFEMLPTYAPYENCGPGGDLANQGIAFADSINGYITDVCHGEFRTTDGGRTWMRTANSGSNISMVTFASSHIGWKLGAGGFYKTANAGASWTAIGGPFWGGTGSFSKIYALNENKLWVLRSSYYDGTGLNFWYSSNGGTNWTEVNTGLHSTNQNQIFYYDMCMSESGIGFVVGSIYHTSTNTDEAIILKTSDMGLTWTITNYPQERFKNILYISDDEWIVLGNQGDYISNNSKVIQRKTTDAGVSWVYSKPLEPIISNSYLYNSIYSQNTDIIYFYAIGGVYKSIDRGTSYQRITSEKDVVINKITFDSKPINNETQLGIAWLQWNTYSYLITFDGGQTWNKKSLPQSMGYIWLVGIAEEVIYLITEQAYLYKSTDSGETWHQLYLNVYSGLQALDVFSKDDFVLSAYKNLVSSTDGGNNWYLGPSLGNVFFKNTSISEPGKIIAVGTYYDTTSERGCIYNTSDYGLSWHLIDTDDDMIDVMMLQDEIGFVLSTKNLYKTTNNGESWKKILSRGGGWYQGFSCFAFRDTLNGTLKSDVAIKVTTDGGKSWVNKDYRIPIPGVDKMEYNAQGDLFMIAGGSMIMLPANHSNSPGNKNSTHELVTEYYLAQNYPNPFNPTTTIQYDLPNDGLVQLEVYDILGRRISTLVNEYKTAGSYQHQFDASNLASGVYIYKLNAGDFVNSHKMIVLK